MQKRRSEPKPNKLLPGICLVVIGLGAGWFLGLSVSPVVSTVLAAITAAAGLLVGAISGVNDVQDNSTQNSSSIKLRWNVDPLPLALLVVGLVGGSIIGICVRNTHSLGSDISSEIQKWEMEGIPREVVASRLFESRYPYSPYTYPYTQTIASLGENLTNTVKVWADLGIQPNDAAHKLFDSVPSINSITAASATETGSSNTGSILHNAITNNECTAIKRQSISTTVKDIELRNFITTQVESTIVLKLEDVISNTAVLREALIALCDGTSS